MHSNKIIGYRVMNCSTGRFVTDHDSNGYCWLSSPDGIQPEPISCSAAFRRLAAYLDQYPLADHNDFEVIRVYHEYTPIETASKDLSARLKSLCSAHGLHLGMTDAQIEAKIAKELEELGAFPVTDQIYTSIGR